MSNAAQEIREAIIQMRENGISEDNVTVTIRLDALMQLVDPDKKYMNDWKWSEEEKGWYCGSCRYWLPPKAPLTNYCPQCGSYNQETWARDMHRRLSFSERGEPW